MDNCTLDTNLAGAVEVAGGTFRAERCTFINNQATAFGGVLYVVGGVAGLFDCLLTGNSAVSAGGAIYSAGGSTVLAEGTRITGNQAPQGASIFRATTGLGNLAYATPAPAGRWILRTGGISCENEDNCFLLNWPELSPNASVQTIAPGYVSEDFPYACSPGLFGGANAPHSEQSGPGCSGLCASGTYCSSGTVVPLTCAPLLGKHEYGHVHARALA